MSTRARDVACVALIAIAPAAAPTHHPAPSLVSGLRAHFARATAVWPADAEADSVVANWRPASAPIPRYPRAEPPLPCVDSTGGPWTGSVDCSQIAWKRFAQGRDTLTFTVGRVPEDCSESPRMVWNDRTHGAQRRAITPLFNWNVDALWCSPDFIVFGATATYEYGQHDEILGIWRLRDGAFHRTAEAELLEDGAQRIPDASIMRLLPGWRTARMAEAGDALVFVKGDSTLVLWPSQGRYARQIAAR